MKETERIVGHLKRSFEGDAWHGAAVLEILDGIDAEAAAKKPLEGVKSIWELVLHLTGTQKLVLKRLDGDENALEMAPEEDWPPVPEPPTEEAWGATIDELKRNEARLRAAVAEFPIEKLDEPLIPGGSPAENQFHGHVQHNLYHAAQIALLKKIQTYPS